MAVDQAEQGRAEFVVNIPKSANEKHLAIKRDMASLGESAYAIGVRLLDMQQGAWSEVTYGGPFADWSRYLNKGLGISGVQARKYMAAAQFPVWCTRQQGIEKMSALFKITELTQVDETPEEAMALVLPLVDGGKKAFSAMTSDEVNEAYRLLRMGEADVERPAGALKSMEEALDLVTSPEGPRLIQLQQKANRALEEWLKPRQLRVRERGGKAYIDVTAVPEEDALEVFEKLVQVLRENQ